MQQQRQQHLFIMDPLDSLRWQIDTSLGIAEQLCFAGHEVYSCELGQLAWNSQKQSAEAQVQRLGFADGQRKPRASGNLETRLLADFSAIHMRKDPPFDQAYLAATWLLDSVGESSVVYNRPSGLRALNEKLSVFLFPDDCHPSFVGARSQDLLEYIRANCAGDGIIKPLDSFGGRGVERAQLAAHNEAEVLGQLERLSDGGRRAQVVQRFCPAIFDGEVRAFALAGKPLAWCLKKPATGSFLANTRAGASLAAYSPSAALSQRVEHVATRLWQEHGIALVGFDLIDELITEINITSPRLLQSPDDSTNYYREIASWMAQHVRTRTQGKN